VLCKRTFAKDSKQITEFSVETLGPEFNNAYSEKTEEKK